MNYQPVFRILALSIAVLPGSLAAQEAIAYEPEGYEYPDQGAQAAQDGLAKGEVVFVQRPVVQPIASVDPDLAMEESAPVLESHLASAGGGMGEPRPRVLYAYPGIYARPTGSTGASRVLYRDGRQRPDAGYVSIYEGRAPMVPPGGRIVQFDREAWLAECRRRLAPVAQVNEYEDLHVSGEDRSRECEAYLDGYMESARTGGLHGQMSATGEYMLVPVTIMIPQRPADGSRD